MIKKTLEVSFYVLMLSLFYNFSYAAKIEIYKVKAPVAGGMLIIYEDPTVHSEQVAKIPVKAKWIIKKSKRRLYGKQYWRKITWNKKTGWVKANNLRLDRKATRNAKKDKRCLKPKVRPVSCNQ